MDADVKLACLIAESLTRGKSIEEIARLQVTLQAISSLLASELSCLRNKGSRAGDGGAGK